METTPHDSDPARAAPAPPGPAADLGDVWPLLDALPPVSARVDLAATTVDLVAAKVAGGVGSREREPAALGTWFVRLVAMAVAVAGGLLAGRATAPDPDRWVLDKLPLVEHLGLLREAGSLEFLEAVARRLADSQGPPRWLLFGRDPQALRDEAREFDDAVRKLEADAAAQARGGDLVEARRRQVQALPAARQADLERAAETFRELSNLDRRELAAVAAALADPKNTRLREAARTWHVILAAMNPVVRRSVIEMPAEERLEMLERNHGRPRDDFRDRRPGEGGEERRPPLRPPVGLPNGAPPGPPNGPQLGPPGGAAQPEGPPGPPRPGAFGRPGPSGPPFRFQPPPAGDPREPPAETPAPPR